MKKLWPIVGLVVVVAIAYGGYYYYRGAPSNEKLVEAALAAPAQWKSVAFEGEVVPSADVREKAGNELGQVVLAGALTLEKDGVPSWGKITVQGKDRTFVVEGRYPRVGVFYLGIKVPDAPASANIPPAVAPFLEMLKGDQWIRFSKEDVEGLQQMFGKAPAALGASEPEKKDSAEEVQKFRRLFGQYKILKPLERLPDGEVDGKKIFRVKVGFDEAQSVAFLEEAHRQSNSKGEIGARERGEARRMYEYLREVNLVIGVSRSGRELTRIEFVPAAPKPDKKPEIESFQITFKDIDRPVTVEEPANAKPFAEFFGQIFGAFLGGAGGPGVPQTP